MSQYRDPRWQRRRLEILQRDGWMCSKCSAADKTLEVHHLFYTGRGRAPWDYPAWCLVSLCEDCHGPECRHGSADIEELVTAIGGYCRDFRDFEDVVGTLTAALKRGLPRNPKLPPVAIAGAAGYALQKAAQAMNLGHDPALVMAAIDAAFDSNFGNIPPMAAEHQEWADAYGRADRALRKSPESAS